MVDKITLANIGSFQNDTPAAVAFNSNNASITTAVNNTLSRDGTSPNQMLSNLDMNSNQILNLPSPATVNSPARLLDVVTNPTIQVPPVGTSGATVPLLSGNNTWSGTNTFTKTTTLKEYVTVLDYGADNTGVVDATSAIAAAITAAAGRRIFFPAGTYKVSSANVLNSGFHLYGDGAANTVISTTSTSADILTVNAPGIIENLQFTSSVTRVSGQFINLASNILNVQLRHLAMYNWWIGILIQGSNPTGLRLFDLYFASPTGTSSVAIQISPTGGPTDTTIRDVLVVASPGTNASAGIAIYSSGDVTIDHFETVYANTGLYISPQSGQTVQTLFVSQSLFDTGNSYGVLIAPASGGTVSLVKLTDVWATSNGSVGISIDGAGNTKEVDITSCNCSLNTGHGILMNSSTVSNVRITGGSMGQNGNGITANTGVKKFSIIGAKVGPVGQFSGNTNGIVLVGSNDNFTIADNDLSGNGTNLSLTSPGTSGIIHDNAGYNPVGVTISTLVGASPATITAGPSPETHYLNQSATNTSTVAKGGHNVHTLVNPSTFYPVHLGPNENYTVTWATTQPTYLKDVH